MLAELQSLEPRAEVEALGEHVRRELRIPARVRLDAFHVAYAISYELDYLLTWNCTHLANADSLRRLADFCRDRDLWLPVVCTPEEMTSERKVE